MCSLSGVRTTPRYLNPCLDHQKETSSSNWEGQTLAVIMTLNLFVLTLYPDAALILIKAMEGTEVMTFFQE